MTESGSQVSKGQKKAVSFGVHKLVIYGYCELLFGEFSVEKVSHVYTYNYSYLTSY